MRNIETLMHRIKSANIKANIQHLKDGCIGVTTNWRNMGKVLDIAELVGYRRIYQYEYEYSYGPVKDLANKTPFIIFY